MKKILRFFLMIFKSSELTSGRMLVCMDHQECYICHLWWKSAACIDLNEHNGHVWKEEYIGMTYQKC